MYLGVYMAPFELHILFLFSLSLFLSETFQHSSGVIGTPAGVISTPAVVIGRYHHVTHKVTHHVIH